ncbi:MAG: hypothetical protein HKN72_05935 [Gemmatimonadetes bacterium]|nr:hypothetical protein [Gemmatimonadota bacterium]
MMNTYVSRRRLIGVTLTFSAVFATAPVLLPSALGLEGQDPATASPGVQTAPATARLRAQQTLPPDVFSELDRLSTEMEAAGVPSEPLFAKALEGAVKRVPPDRLVAGVRAHAGRLQLAREALGPAANAPLLVAGADALQRGVSADALRSLPRDRPHSPVALLILAELMETGVPADRALETVQQAMQQRLQDRRMLDIPARVRRLIRDGVPPREAIDRVRRMMRRDRGGMVGPHLPIGDAALADQRIIDWRRRGG